MQDRQGIRAKNDILQQAWPLESDQSQMDFETLHLWLKYLIAGFVEIQGCHWNPLWFVFGRCAEPQVRPAFRLQGSRPFCMSLGAAELSEISSHQCRWLHALDSTTPVVILHPERGCLVASWRTCQPASGPLPSVLPTIQKPRVRYFERRTIPQEVIQIYSVPCS